jgi:acyl-CoA thioesterase
MRIHAYGTYFNTDTVFKMMEMKINFIRPVSKGKITAIGKVVHKGSRIVVVEAEIWSAEHKLVAKAQGTMTF